jgi:Fe-S oxidoreductase
MPLPTGDVIGLMMDNLKMRKTVFPMPPREAVRWAENLNIPEGGETVIYTGFMYQLLPYMVAAVKRMEGMEESFLGRFVGLGRFFNKMINVSAIMFMPSRADQQRFRRIIRDIATLLRSAGVEFGYLYKAEMYTGALAYDMGVDDTFAAHARKVYGMLKEHGVRSLITIDPHTTNMLRSVYPKFIDGFDIEVRSYLEVLAASDLRPVHGAGKEIAVHDSCVYARYEGIIEEPRQLLERAGYTVVEPKDTRELTHCCGGPIESIFPTAAHHIGEKRVQQFRDADGKSVATMCPICMATLQKASNGDLEIGDISGFLVKAFCGETKSEERSRNADDERSEP